MSGNIKSAYIPEREYIHNSEGEDRKTIEIPNRFFKFGASYLINRRRKKNDFI